jgi:hypothetical protein
MICSFDYFLSIHLCKHFVWKHFIILIAPFQAFLIWRFSLQSIALWRFLQRLPLNTLQRSQLRSG